MPTRPRAHVALAACSLGPPITASPTRQPNQAPARRIQFLVGAASETRPSSVYRRSS